MFRARRTFRRVRLVLVCSVRVGLRGMLILYLFVALVVRDLTRLLCRFRLLFGELAACGAWIKRCW